MLGLNNTNVSYRNYECVVKLSNESFGRNRCNVSVKDIKKAKDLFKRKYAETEQPRWTGEGGAGRVPIFGE